MDEDINDKIEQLEKAIKQLDAVKRHLLHNATEIKGQVQTTMSRHLEALRNREVWLLSQVDLVFSAKEAVLQAQQARLNKMLGVLQSTIGLTADSNSNSNSILVETLHKLDINLNDLNPEETAFFTFRADPSDLRNTILNYGHVDANGMPLSGAFHEPESQTLPRHFEDYDGPDHHIFYKTVSDNKQTEDCGIYVNIPKLSTKAEDWLLYSTTTTTANTETTPNFSFPPFSSNWLDWIRQKSPGTPAMFSPSLRTISSDASIKDWLCQIKQYADPEEEEDFEIVDKSGLSTASSDSYTSIPDIIPVKPTISNLDLKHLEFPTAVQSWLKTNRSTPEDKPVDVPNFFQHIPSDPDLWLIHQTEKKTTCEDCQPGLTTDIENLGKRLNNLTCTTTNITSSYQTSLSTEDKQCWLQSETVLEMPHVLDVCKANELCDGFEECVCSPHCGFQHIGITDNNHWLITKNQESCQNKAMKFDEKWLSPNKALTTNNHDFKVSFPLFEEVTRNPECWLKTDSIVKDVDFEDIFNIQCSNDYWLKSPKLSECNDNESNSSDMFKNHHSETNTSDWLLQTTYGQSHPRDSNKQMWLMSPC